MRDVRCMELNIHYEARGESDIGKKAVALVTANRAKSKKFPSDICSVVYQPGQFSWVKQFPNHHKTKVSPRITQIAIETLTNKYHDVTRGALYFNTTTIEPFNKQVVATIGNHRFYR